MFHIVSNDATRRIFLVYKRCYDYAAFRITSTVSYEDVTADTFRCFSKLKRMSNKYGRTQEKNTVQKK
jgi:hypothetical protein